MKKITADATKFAHIIGALPQEVAKSVKDILIMPPNSNKYFTLKESLCSEYSPSSYESAFKLFNLPSNNDGKPIKVMEKMLRLLPHDTKPCWLFQLMFLQKLLRCELARLNLKDFINKPRDLALEATKHWEKRSASTSSVLSEDPGEPILHLLPSLFTFTTILAPKIRSAEIRAPGLPRETAEVGQDRGTDRFVFF